MKTPRKHAELIKAWADGAEIELKMGNEEWHSISRPHFMGAAVYRIKPERKPDVVKYGFADSNAAGYFHKDKWPGHNIKLTLDGETGKLKAAEVLI
jgi:hypothetical protein